MSQHTATTCRRIAAAVLAGVLAATVAVIAPPTAQAAPSAPGWRLSTVARGLTGATALAPLPDGRVLVAEQRGTLRLVERGVLRRAPVLTLTVDARGERGLIGVAVAPDVATTGHIYVHYTVPGSHNRVTRYTLGRGTVARSPKVLLDLPSLGATNHNGGALHLGRDGALYVAVGENAVPVRAQDRRNPFGKILRIDAATGAPVAGNPYRTGNGWTRRIWAYGLRNPYTFAVHPTTGRILVNDVGSSGPGAREEINPGRAAANYGWPRVEGLAGDRRFVRPVVAYRHTGRATESGCSIAGGAFLAGVPRLPRSYADDYLYGDYCGGWVRRYDPVAKRTALVASGLGPIVDLRAVADGTVWVLGRSSVRRLAGRA